MRVVNLARRPFINRRPIVRFAALLWLAGILLLSWNVRLYRGHWQGTAENRRLLDEAQAKLLTERQNRDRLAGRLTGVNLREQNRQSAFLNSLISHRTFPWSALFDDLEGVLPAEVKMSNVQPVVRLATEIAREGRLAARRRSAAERDNRRTSRSRRRGSSGGPPPAATEPTPRPKPEDPQLAPDEVALRLTGQAKTEDALVELVDRLFENPAFRRPVLDSEHFDASQKATRFSLSVVYLTRREPVVGPLGEEDLEPELAEAEAAVPLPGAGSESPAGDAAGLERETLPLPAGAADAGARSRLAVSADRSDRGSPGRQAPAAKTLDRETSDRGAPGRRPPVAGAPNRGSPHRRTAVAGGTVTGSPGRGAPAADTSGLGSPGRGAQDDETRSQPRLADRESTEPDVDRGISAPDRPDRSEREGEGPPGEDADDEPGLGERDASSTPALDSGGQVRLRRGPDRERPRLLRLAGGTVDTRKVDPRTAAEAAA